MAEDPCPRDHAGPCFEDPALCRKILTDARADALSADRDAAVEAGGLCWRSECQRGCAYPARRASCDGTSQEVSPERSSGESPAPVAGRGFWDRLGYDEGMMPKHLPMGVNARGQGPEDDSKAHHYECWCADPECPLTKALLLASSSAGRGDADVEAVLAAHHCQGNPAHCACGWKADVSRRWQDDYVRVLDQYAAHVAAALAPLLAAERRAAFIAGANWQASGPYQTPALVADAAASYADQPAEGAGGEGT